MSLDRRWEYDPDHEHVAGGIPAPMVAEVERLAGQVVDLAGTGVDVTDFGNGLRPGGWGAWTPPTAGSTFWWRRATG